MFEGYGAEYLSDQIPARKLHLMFLLLSTKCNTSKLHNANVKQEFYLHLHRYQQSATTAS